MKYYTPFEIICIDIANQAGLDKKLFEERIQWVKDNFNQLTVISTPRKERPLYVKAVMALFDTCRGKEIGHMVGFDATCSGMSIMSVLTKCVRGCIATNLIDPDKRNDAYTMVTNAASAELGAESTVSRDDAKNATMTALYGSQAEPKKVFGEDTPELAAFYKGLMQIAPGACEMLDDLRAAWQSFALEHRWILPDNFHAVIKVMTMQEARIEVDELGGSTFTHYYYINEGTERDLKLIANVTHSFDAYLLRSLERRCHYNHERVLSAYKALIDERTARDHGEDEQDLHEITEPAHVYMARWSECGVPDAVLLDHLNDSNVVFMADDHIDQMITMASDMLSYQSFPIVTVHDEFKCHPNHANQMRKHYVSVMADLARGRALEDVYEQITGDTPFYANAMDGDELAEQIMQSNYAIS